MLVNGEPAAEVAATDRGFQYGDGVFTTLPLRRGVPELLDRHLARLERDCARLAIPFPGRDALIEDTRKLISGGADGVLKIQLTRGVGGRGYRPPEPALATRVLGLYPPPEHPPELARDGVAVRLCATRLGINPRLAGVKHMNRLEQILARAEWRDGEFHEGLMRDARGWVTEGTMTNLFLTRDGLLLTPKLDHCGVAGVMRALVMEVAAGHGVAVEETRLHPDDLDGADELFLTNSLIGVWPIRRIDGRATPVGPLTREIAGWLAAKIQAEAAAVSG